MARQYAKSAAVQRTILEACSAAFGESGFHGVSMAEIARRARISHTGLLHHFPRKEALLTAILDLQDERTGAAMQERRGGLRELDPVDLLREMIGTLFDQSPEVGIVELGAVLSGEATSLSHPAHDYFRDRYRDVRHYLSRQFARLAAEGRVSSSLDADQLAALLVATVEGLHKQWLYERDDTVAVTAVVEGMLASLVPELRAGSSSTMKAEPGESQSAV
jgi:AcrR family transcriptional regulator